MTEHDRQVIATIAEQNTDHILDALGKLTEVIREPFDQLITEVESLHATMQAIHAALIKQDPSGRDPHQPSTSLGTRWSS